MVLQDSRVEALSLSMTSGTCAASYSMAWWGTFSHELSLTSCPIGSKGVPVNNEGPTLAGAAVGMVLALGWCLSYLAGLQSLVDTEDGDDPVG